MRRLDGLPYRVTDRDSGLLVATDEGSWRTLRTTLFRHQRRCGAAVRRGADLNGIALAAVGRLTSTEGNCTASTTVYPIASQECTISAH